MPGQVITITSGKGGVGKTTTAGNLAVALAQLGQGVVCLDLDIGLRNLDLVLGLENRIVYDIVDVIEGRVRWRQALVRDKRQKGLYLLPATQWREKDALSASQVEKLCQDLATEFDFLLVDSPAGIEDGFWNAVAPADQILVVATPEVSSVRDASRVVELLEEAGKPVPRLVLNRVRPVMVKNGDMLTVEDVLELLKIELIGIIPEDQDVIAKNNSGSPVVFTRGSNAGAAFLRISRRLMGEQVPIPAMEPTSWLGRLSVALGR